MLKYLFIICFSFSGFTQTMDENNLLLWEISGNGLTHKSYIYGSLHSNDRRLFNLSDSVYYALDEADAIVLEIDAFSLFDYEGFNHYSRLDLNYDRHGDPYTSSNEATTSSYGDEDGMPQFLDAYFQQYCHNSGKDFIALETLESQIDAMKSMGDINYYEMNLETIFLTTDDMVEVYLEGDIYELDKLMNSSLSMYSDGYSKLIVERNFAMVDTLENKLKNQKLFCAVGAGHLAGGSGIINLLRSKGYTVRNVLATYEDKKSKAEIDVKSNRTYQYHNDTLGMHIEFFGKPMVINNENEGYTFKLIYKDLGQDNSYEVEVYKRDSEMSIEELAEMYIASPEESPFECMETDYGTRVCEGIANSYPEGFYWARILLTQDEFIIIKVYGGNKFMTSSRPFNFFNKVWFE